MDKIWKSKQLDLLKNGQSLFRWIPDNIGEIYYCDSTEERSEPYSAEEKKKKTIGGVVFAVVGLGLIWGFLYAHYIWASILSVIIFLIVRKMTNFAFKGKDFFVGDQGFAIAEFSETRSNVVRQHIFLFKDVLALFTGETIQMQNYSYTGTSYFFEVFNVPVELDKELVFTPIYKIEGYYRDKEPQDPMNPQNADAEYCFMKAVEVSWTQFFVNRTKSLPEIQFPMAVIVDKKYRILPYVTLTDHSIIVNDKEYTRENTKKIYFSNGNLVIEHNNHTKKLLGLIEKGDISNISMTLLGNKRAFLTLFNQRFS
ncbi:MAG: hypothetical protein J6T70_19605 [Bacteroidales bacterium]|nr:hypothetical protein [Bacteroidales bacterium]